MKKILSIFASCFLALTASAMPVQPGTFTARQSDGTILTLRLVGDEHFHYYVDVNSGCKMLRADNGDYYVASDAQMSTLKTAADLRRTAANERRVERLPYYQANIAGGNGPSKVPGTFSGALTGTRKGLVILVNFAGTALNLPYEFTTTRQQWDDAFNKVGFNDNNHVGSVHDYFYDQSYGLFDLEFDVVGPVTVSHDLEYYGKNNSYDSDTRPYSMVVEACKLVNEQVNFDDYDWDGDGEVDQVYLIYAGYGESTSGADPNTIWPHEFTLLNSGYHQRLKLDHVYVNTYACSNELCGTSGVQQNGIGTACHEFSHCIGFPDFYDTDYSGAFAMDAMDIMCNGGHNGPGYNCEIPSGYTAYERWMAGWLTPKVLKEGCYVEGMKDIGSTPEAYIIYNDAHKSEYFLLENRRAERWYSYLEVGPGHHGLLVTHVDFDQEAWSWNTVNDDPAHQRMTIVPAGCNYGNYLEKYKSWNVSTAVYQSMTFPGSKRVHAFTDDTHFDFGGKLWHVNKDKSYKLGKAITDIREDNDEGTISFTFMGNVDFGKRFTVTLDAGIGSVAQSAWQQTENHEKFLLPAATSADPTLTFLGWTTEHLAPTTTRPATILPEGTGYQPKDDVTLYAVYGKSDNGPLAREYRYATTLRNGHNYVFASKNAPADAVYALSAKNLSADAFVKNPEGEVVEVQTLNEVPTILNPELTSVWHVYANEDEITLENGIYHLVLNTTEGHTLSSDVAYAGWDDKYGLYVVKAGTTTKNYLRCNNGSFVFNRTASASARLYAYELSDLSDKEVTYLTGESNGILTVTTQAGDTAIYDLQGRRLSQTPARGGAYIKAGKVVLR